jgi:hypothetical protein
MKRLIYVLSISVFFFLSCSKDFLELVPEGAVTSGSFYQTEAHFNQALVGAYQALRNVKGSTAAWVMGDFRSDNTHYKYNPGNRGSFFLESVDLFLNDQTNVLSESKYNECYVGIARTNIIIDRLEKVELGENVEKDIVAQAKFLRALFYFELVRYFGGVPLYLNEVVNSEGAYLQRSSVEEVYAVIESDAKDAIAQLPLPTTNQNGRATKSSARMLLADVYLTQKKYAEAEVELKAIIDSGVHGLLPEYASAFNPANKNSIESVFEVQYKQGSEGQASDFVYNFIPLSSDISKIVGFPANHSSGGGFNTPTQDLINSYEENDERLEASIAIAEGTGPVGNMVIESVKSPKGYVTPAGKRSDAFIKKYLYPHSLQFNTDNNFPIYRYSDVLLTMAEVLNEQNKPSDALLYLNPVRQRAGLLPATELNQSALRDIIAHERRVEFAFENKRWFDLVRTGKAIEVMTEHGNELKVIYAGEGYIPTAAYTVTQNKLLFPIPLREVQIGKLEQNPGYQ